MPVPSAISDLSQTASSNSPAGSESPTTADDYFRAHASFIARLRDGAGYAAEATVASAATADIGAAASLYVQITGTTTITSFGTNYNGPRFIRFAGALTLTHNASTLILPGGANIVTAAGDTAVVVPQSAGWRVVSYQRAAAPAGIESATAVTASGTSVDFTGIPSWVKRVTVMFDQISTNGTSPYIVQIGDSGGVETSGYTGSVASAENASATVAQTVASGFGLIAAVGAATTASGVLTLVRMGSLLWAASGTAGLSNGAVAASTGGSKSLTGSLDRVRLTTIGGVDTFDTGNVNVLYE